MSALTVGELVEKLSRVQPDRVVLLNVHDVLDAKGDSDTLTVVDAPTMILKNAHPVDGSSHNVLEIGLVVNAPH